MSGKHLAFLLERAVSKAERIHQAHTLESTKDQRIQVAAWARRDYLAAMKAAGMPEHLAEKEFQAAYTKRTGQQFLFPNNQ